MKKIVMILDQIQSGVGGKEKSNLSLSGKTLPLGPGIMMEPFLNDSKIIATLFCGDEFFTNNIELVVNKIIEKVKQINPDVVVCGPSYDYENFSIMCALLAHRINANTSIPAFAAMSEENNDVINKYKDIICIVKTPKKGGVGLNKCLKNICILAEAMSNKENIEYLKNKLCYC